MDRDVEYVKKFKGYQVRNFDGSAIVDTEFVSASQTPNFDFETMGLSDDILCLVGAQDLKSDKAIKAYFDSSFTGWGDKSRLHLIAYEGKIPSFWSKTKAQIRNHDKLKSWGSDVQDWVEAEIKSRSMVVSVDLVKALLGVVGTDLYRLSSELGKLEIYLQGKPATQEDLKAIVTPGSNLMSWDIAERVLLKDLKGALNRLSRVYRYAGEDPSLAILGSLMKSTEKALIARALADKGLAADDIAATLGLHPYRYKMSIGLQVERSTREGLISAMRALAELDLSLKRTPFRRTVIELAIYQITTN